MEPLIKLRVPLVRNDRHYYVDPTNSDDFDLAEYTLNAFDVNRIDKISRKDLVEMKIFTGDLEPIHIVLEKSRFLDDQNYIMVKEHIERVYKTICKFKSLKTRADKRLLHEFGSEIVFEEMLYNLGLLLPDN